jgi:hypothetical protein
MKLGMKLMVLGALHLRTFRFPATDNNNMENPKFVVLPGRYYTFQCSEIVRDNRSSKTVPFLLKQFYITKKSKNIAAARILSLRLV